MSFIARIIGVVLACALPFGAAAATSAAGEAARIVAGLQPDPAGFEPAARALFPSFAHDVNQQWDGYRRAIGAPMAQWACSEIESAPGETIFYPFSGPDLPTVHQIYPDAARYVMVAMQRAGLPPALERQSTAELKRTLGAYRLRWRFFARTGFFRTNDLEDFSRRHEVTVSVTSQLMAFAARLGFEVESVEPMRVGASGALEPATEDPALASTWSAVRLMLSKGGRRVQLDYVSMDLSDSMLHKYKANRAFVDQITANRTLVKAASHLLQKHYFSILRGAILARAPSVLQDETGIDYAALAGVFNTRLYGKFVKPHNLFQSDAQQSLAAAYQKATDVKPLAFRLGYDKAAGYSVVAAVRGGGAGVPARQCAATP